jgi:hypothetical protein
MLGFTMNKKIIEYGIVQHQEFTKVIKEVNDMMKIHGWQPFGGVSTSGDGSTTYFAQAIVKYEA